MDSGMTSARARPHRCGCGELCVPRDSTETYPIELGAPRGHDRLTAADWLAAAGVVAGLVLVVVTVLWATGLVLR